MREVKCAAPVPVNTYVRDVIKTGRPIMLVDVIDKPISSGIANTSRVRLCSLGNNLLIQPC